MFSWCEWGISSNALLIIFLEDDKQGCKVACPEEKSMHL